jgi:hypothetical protein
MQAGVCMAVRMAAMAATHHETVQFECCSMCHMGQRSLVMSKLSYVCCLLWFVLQGFMYLFGLVAVAFAVYGLATVDKNVTDGAFNILTVITDYANGAFDKLDRLLDTISGTTDM